MSRSCFPLLPAHNYGTTVLYNLFPNTTIDMSEAIAHYFFKAYY